MVAATIQGFNGVCVKETEMNELQNLAKFTRYLLDSENLLIVRGDISPVLAGMYAYNARYRIDPPHENLVPIATELLAATALSALSLTDRESWGWSLTFKGMPTGFFVGLEPEGMVCLRILPADSGKVSGMVQRQKAGLPMTQSHIEPRSASPKDVAEQYFSEVVQIRTRLAVIEAGAGVLLQSLPGGSFNAVKNLDSDALFEYVDRNIASGEAREVGEVLLFYECRCSEEMISRLVHNMSESDRKHLFGSLTQIEMECPRCGKEYTVRKSDRSVH